MPRPQLPPVSQGPGELQVHQRYVRRVKRVSHTYFCCRRVCCRLTATGYRALSAGVFARTDFVNLLSRVDAGPNVLTQDTAG